MEAAQEPSFGERLRREREQRNWTQAQLAEHIGGSVPSIHRWENDKSSPRPSMREALYRVFEKTAETFGILIPRQLAWNIPFLRNPYFTGRKQILLDLHRTLAAENTVALSQTRAISGLGGIGKTQTALEYAYRYANEYEAVLWVQADSHETLVSDFAKLAQTLDLREKEETDQFRVITAIKRWLQEHGPWLLIFDNADDLAVVSDFLPRQAAGATLLTTRSQITGPHIKKIAMEKMSREEGVIFLLRRITSDEDENGEKDLLRNVSDAERRAAEELWELMDGLPLALDQAGAYIEARQCSLTDYLDLFHHHRNILLQERGGPISEHPDAVATTWTLSFQQVEQKDPAAAELLRLCAFLAPDTIPEELLTRGAAHFTALLQALAASPLLLNDAISTLRAYSLVRREPRGKTLSIHRLVQAVLQDTLEETERRSWAKRVMQAINAAFPHPEHGTWPQCERLLPHALLAAHSIETDQIIDEEAGRLLYETATYLQDRGRYQEAEPLFQRALRIREQQLGPEHLNVAYSLNGLAALYREQGKYAEVELLFQRALRIREQQLGPEHTDVATSLNGLALLCYEQGRYAEAEPLYQRALRILEQQMGSEHTDVATLLNNLANLYRDQGRYAEAEPFYQRALHIWEQQLGPEHTDVAYSLNNLATLYYKQGRYAEAESLFQRALHIWEQQLGPEHPLVAHPLNNLADLCREQGRYAEAKSLFQRALRIWEQQLGPEHPLVAYPLNNLADLYREQGKYGEAEPLYQRALYIWEQQLGPEHPNVAYPLHGLALLFYKQGKYAEAEPLHQRALRIREQQLGPENPETAEVLHDFAVFREAQGNLQEALSLYQRALAIREHALGPHHPSTRATQQRVLSLFQGLSQHDKAASLPAMLSELDRGEEQEEHLEE